MDEEFFGGLGGLGGFADNAEPLTPEMLDGVKLTPEELKLFELLAGQEAQSGQAMGPPDSRPRGIRNNNPGNVEFRPKDPWEGQVSRETTPSGGQGRFAVFETPEHGIRAMAKLLENYQTKHGLDTLEKITNRYAPPHENNSAGYAKFVGDNVGLQPNEPFRFSEDPERAMKIITTMIRKENSVMPYSSEQISRGFRMAFPPVPVQSASQ